MSILLKKTKSFLRTVTQSINQSTEEERASGTIFINGAVQGDLHLVEPPIYLFTIRRDELHDVFNSIGLPETMYFSIED